MSNVKSVSKKAGALTLTAASLSVVAAGFASNASAAYPGEPFGIKSAPIYSPVTGLTDVVHYGIYNYNGTKVICIDSTLRLQPNLASGKDVSNPKVGYALDKYLNTTDKYTAAALARYVKAALDGQPSLNAKAWATVPQAEKDKVNAKLDAITKDVNDNAGPYKMSVDLKASSVSAPTDGTIDVAIKSASGKNQAGYGYTATLSGPAKFLNGSQTWSAKTEAGLSTLKWKATSNGTVKVKVVANGLSATSYSLHDSPSNIQQDFAGTTSTNVSVSGSDSLALAPEAPQPKTYAPKVSTKISTPVVKKGDIIKDAYTITGGKPNSTVSVTFDGYGNFVTVPAERAADDQAEYTKTIEVELDDNGEASGVVELGAAQNDGLVRVQETLAAGKDGSDTWPEYISPWGEEAETAKVETPETPDVNNPKITTNVTTPVVKKGDVVKDSYSITDGIPNSTVTVRFDGYGGFDVVPATRAADDKPEYTKTVQIKLDSNGEAKGVIELGTAKDDGLIRIQETLEAGKDGNSSWPEYVSPWTEQAETSKVLDLKGVTQVQNQVVNAGSPVTDNVTITGSRGEEVTTKWTAYSTKAADQASCMNLGETGWAAKIADGSAKVFDQGQAKSTKDGVVSVTTKNTPSDGSVNCITFKEDLQVGDRTFTSTKPGEVHEVTFVKHETPQTPPAKHETPAPPVKHVPTTPAPVINTGDQGTESNSAQLAFAAAGVLGALGATSAYKGRRRLND